MDPSAIVELLPWSGMGLTGILAVGIGMILTGRLVPKSTVEEMRKERDARLADLKSAYNSSEQARNLLAEQNAELIESSRVSAELLKALRAVGGDRT